MELVHIIGKTASEFPFHLTFPIITALIIYYIVGLSVTSADKIIVLSNNLLIHIFFNI